MQVLNVKKRPTGHLAGSEGRVCDSYLRVLSSRPVVGAERTEKKGERNIPQTLPQRDTRAASPPKTWDGLRRTKGPSSADRPQGLQPLLGASGAHGRGGGPGGGRTQDLLPKEWTLAEGSRSPPDSPARTRDRGRRTTEGPRAVARRQRSRHRRVLPLPAQLFTPPHWSPTRNCFSKNGQLPLWQDRISSRNVI